MLKGIIIGIVLVVAISAFQITANDCPLDREELCVDQFAKALPFCKKAAQGKGKDTAADLNCMKYFYDMQTDCWPCICYVANQEKVQIKGCTQQKL